MSQKQNNIPKFSQKNLRQWHKWVGYGSLILVLILSITGLILNRTEKFNLNQIQINNSYILWLYDLSPKTSLLFFNDDGHWLSWLEGNLYYNNKLISQNTPAPIGLVKLDHMIIVGSNDRLTLFLTDGTLVESLYRSDLPSEITMLGKTKKGMPVIISKSKKFTSDNDLISWYEIDKTIDVTLSMPTEGPSLITEQIMQNFQGQGVSLYKIILDLHSGRIMGSFGSYIMDLAAISLIFLCITGLMKRRRPEKTRRKRSKQ